MKKLIALLIAILFVVSLIPVTFAQKNLREKIASRVEERAEIMAMTAEQIRAYQKEQLMIAVDKCKENNMSAEICEKKLQNRIQLIDKLKEKDLTRLQKIEARKLQKLEELKNFEKNPKLLKFKRALEFKARKIAQTKLIKAKGDYLKAREKYQEARKNYIDAKNEFKEIKQELKDCKGNTTECNQLREQIKERAKEFLLKTADNILEHLNKIKANVESNEDLSDEEAAEILAKIDEMIKEIEDAKSTIEASENKDEIIEAAKTIKQAWAKIRKRLAIHTGRIVNSRIGGIIVKTKQLEVKLERILARMEEKGIDTTQIQTLIDEFNAKINESKTNYENALDKFKEAVSAEDVKAAHELALEGHKLMKAAHKSLQEAQKLLRDIVLSIKQKGGEDELEAPDDEAEEEAEEEVEEETEEEAEEEEEEEEAEEETESEEEEEEADEEEQEED